VTKPTTLITAAAIGAVVLTTATPAAWAYWTGGGTGSGTAKANALGTPTVTANALLGIPTFRVNTAPAGLSPSGYTVTQAGNPVCSISGTTGSCTQLAIYLGGPVSFTITATRGSWTSLTPTTCTFPLLGTLLSKITGPANCAPATGGSPQSLAVTQSQITNQTNQTNQTQVPAPTPPVTPPVTPAPTASPTDPAPTATPTTTPSPTPTTPPTTTPTTSPTDPATPPSTTDAAGTSSDPASTAPAAAS
jgi:hypothetical protein